MGTCGYITQRPPIGKVAKYTIRLTSFTLTCTLRPLTPTQAAIASGKFRPSKPEKMEFTGYLWLQSWGKIQSRWIR